MIIKGVFDFQNVRDTLTEYPEHEFVQDEYEGVEFWIGDPDSDEPVAMAFLEKMLIFGEVDYVEDAVRVSINKESSIYDDPDVKAVVSKLLPGIQIRIGILGAANGNPASISGSSAFNSIRGDEIINSEGLYKFESAEYAEAALVHIQDSLTDLAGYSNVDVQLKGEFIEFTGEMEISDYYYR